MIKASHEVSVHKFRQQMIEVCRRLESIDITYGRYRFFKIVADLMDQTGKPLTIVNGVAGIWADKINDHGVGTHDRGRRVVIDSDKVHSYFRSPGFEDRADNPLDSAVGTMELIALQNGEGLKSMLELLDDEAYSQMFLIDYLWEMRLQKAKWEAERPPGWFITEGFVTPEP